MSERAPSSGSNNPNSDLPQFAVTMDKNGRPRIYSKENADAPKIALKEVDLLASVNHSLAERENYNMGYEDAKAEAKKIEVTSPDDSPEEGNDNPKKAKWNTLHDGVKDIEIVGEGEPLPDGRATYKTKEHGDVPQDEVELEASETTGTDGDEKDSTTEKESNKEKLRREAIDPERILELKDQFEREFSKELELHNIKTDEDKHKDPWTVKSSAEHVKNKILREYLKIAETDWDAEELEEIRQDVLNMMELSQKTLENLMLKPASPETPSPVEPSAEPTPIEPDPIIIEPGPTTIEPDPTLVTPSPVPVEPTPEPTPEPAPPPVEAVAYTWDPKVGDRVSVKRGDGVMENGWTIRKIYEMDGVKRIMASTGPETGGPYQEEVDKTYEEFLQWQVEAGGAGKSKEKDTKLTWWDKAKFFAYPPNALGWAGSRFSRKEKEVIEKDKRRGGLGLALACLALGAAGIELLEHLGESKGIPKLGVGQHLRDLHQQIDPDAHGPNSGAGLGLHNGLDTGSGGGPSHTEIYNPLVGNHGVGVELPSNLSFHQAIPGGEYSFTDQSGNVLVHHVGWDTQGNLDQATRDALRDHGYELTQDQLGYVSKNGELVHHYMTDVSAA